MNKNNWFGCSIFKCLFSIMVLLTPLAIFAEDIGPSPMAVSLEPMQGSNKILTINTDGGAKHYSLTELEQLGLWRMQTSTFWKVDDGVYEGVLLKDLLIRHGLELSNEIYVVALDGYSASIQRLDWETWPVLIATRRDGQPMSIRAKGPTRVIYPIDLDPILKETNRRVQWVWALKSIQAKGK